MEQMWMPETIEEFLDEFAFEDEERAYTNGATLISMLRVKQAIEHYFRDVAPVVHAKWDENGRCTHCGSHAPYYGMASTYFCSPYCFNCGARMDLKEGENDGTVD